MNEREFKLTVEIYESESQLTDSDQLLLQKARTTLSGAYAPYSGFNVGAAVLLDNGTVITGSNQENASYPVGICGERVALFAASAQYPDVGITTVAICTEKADGKSTKPSTPCGLCRQVMVEMEERQQKPIKLILKGEEGEVWIVPNTGDLLPFHFDSSNL